MYAPQSDFGSTSFSLRWTEVTVEEQTFNAGDPIVLRANFHDTTTSPPDAALLDDFSYPTIKDRTLKFSLQDNMQPQQTGVTDSDGWAYVNFEPIQTAGEYKYYVGFDTDGTYRQIPSYTGQINEAIIRIGLRPTFISAENVTDASAGQEFWVSATLYDTSGGENVELDGKEIAFIFLDKEDNIIDSGSVFTDSNGKATFPFDAPLIIDEYKFTARYDGDGVKYDSSEGEGTITIKKNVTELKIDPVEVSIDDNFYLGAALETEQGDPVQGAEVSFIYNGEEKKDDTGPDGTVSVEFTAVAPVGLQHFSVVYIGDEFNEGDEKEGNVDVILRPTELEMMEENTKYINIENGLELKAVLRDTNGDTAIIGETVVFSFRDYTDGEELTGDNGEAVCHFPAEPEAGAYSYTVNYNGKPGYYDTCVNSKEIELLKRPTQTDGDEVDSVSANEEFKAVVTVTDELNQGGADGVYVEFNFLDQGPKGITTNADGYAEVVFNAPSIAGDDYNYTVTCLGNEIYGTSQDNTNPVHVRLINTIISVPNTDIQVGVGQDFTAEATLFDDDGEQIPNRPITFVFNGGDPIVEETGPNGIASHVFAAPEEINEYSYTAYFAGDETYEDAGPVARTVMVMVGETRLEADPVEEVRIGDEYEMRAFLSNYATGEPIGNKGIKFTSHDLTVVWGTTGDNGCAVVKYQAPDAAGNGYNYTAEFLDEENYTGSEDADNNINVLKRDSELSMDDMYAVVGEDFDAVATLYDKNVWEHIVGVPVEFVFNTEIKEDPETSSEGEAAVTFTAPDIAEPVAIYAYFSETDRYYGCSAEAHVFVVKKNTTIESDNQTAKALDDFTVSALLKDSNGDGIDELPVFFHFDFDETVTESDTTESGGIASVSLAAPAKANEYNFIVEFEGNQTYAGSGEQQYTLMVEKRPTLIAAKEIVSALALDPLIVDATVADEDGKFEIDAGFIDFRFSFEDFSIPHLAEISDNGFAAFTLDAPEEAGSYTYSVRFVENDTYLSSEDNEGNNITVDKRESEITADNLLTAIAGEDFTAGAKLIDKNRQTDIQQKPVEFIFNFGPNPYEDDTDSDGRAAVSVKAPWEAGGYLYTARFGFNPEDNTYYPCEDSGNTIEVSKRVTVVNADSEIIADALDDFTASADLIDDITKEGIEGKQLRFTFYFGDEVVLYGDTLPGGTASVSVDAPAEAGEYQYKVEFIDANDATYDLSGDTQENKIVVQKRETNIAVFSDPESVEVDQDFKARATLTDKDGAVPEQTIYFSFPGRPDQQNNTDNDGETFVTYSAPGSTGVYKYTAAFGDNITYGDAAAEGEIAVVGLPSSIIVADPDPVKVLKEFTLSAQLVDGNGDPITNQDIRFTFDFCPESPITDDTDEDGKAYATLSAPLAAGEYTAEIHFAGSPRYKEDTANCMIAVQRTDSILEADELVETHINEPFNVSARLVDEETEEGVPFGLLTFRFYFDEGVLEIPDVEADSQGNAVVELPALSGIGEYYYEVYFEGNDTYEPSSDTEDNIISVSKRPTELSAEDEASGIALDEITVHADLSDTLKNGEGVEGENIIFEFGFEQPVAIPCGTGTDGRAEVIVEAPAKAGVYYYTARYDGSPVYESSIDDMENVITVSKRQTSMIAFPYNTVVDDTFKAKIELSDHEGFVIGENVIFSFPGKEDQPAQTDENGIVEVEFDAPESSGTYHFGALFAENDTYEGTSAQGDVIVAGRMTTLAIDSLNKRVNEDFTAVAKLTDTELGSLINGEEIEFRFNFVPELMLSGNTVDGTASVADTAPEICGVYVCTAAFAGSGRYDMSQGTAAVTIVRRDSVIEADEYIESFAKEDFSANARLTDDENNNISGREVVFTFGFDPPAAINSTTQDGTAGITTEAPSVAGDYQYAVRFPDTDLTYGPSEDMDNNIVHVKKRPAFIEILPDAELTRYALEDFNVTARLVDEREQGFPIAHRPINFTFNFEPVLFDDTVNTASNGQAQEYLKAGEYAGEYEYTVAFRDENDPTYETTEHIGSITLNKRPAAIAFAEIPSPPALEEFSIAATLTDDLDPDKVIEGREIRFEFYFDFENPSALTYSDTAIVYNGRAQMDGLTAPATAQSYVVKAVFDTDNTYGPDSVEGVIDILKRQTTLEGEPVNAVSGEEFEVMAHLFDKNNYEDLSGQQIKFTFNDDFVYGKTDPDGVAKAVFIGPTKPGLSEYRAEFEGSCTYDKSSTTATVKTGLLSTLLCFDVEPIAKNNFDAKIRLIGPYSEGVGFADIKFEFEGDEAAQKTNDNGYANVTFKAPDVYGEYFFYAGFEGDDIYAESKGAGCVTVKRRPTSLVTWNIDVPVFNQIKLTAELKDLDENCVIKNSTVTFKFQEYEDVVCLTGDDGKAAAVFDGLPVPDDYEFTVLFEETDTYMADESTGTVTVIRRDPALIVHNIDTNALRDFELRAELKYKDSGVEGRDLIFSFDSGDEITVKSDENGMALLPMTAPEVAGQYTYTVRFEEDVWYAGKNGAAIVDVALRPTAIIMSDLSQKANEMFTIAPKLVDLLKDEEGITGMSVRIEFNGEGFDEPTQDGFASHSFMSPGITGVLISTVSFSGNVTYEESETHAKVTIGSQNSFLESDDVYTYIDEFFVCRATLYDSISTDPVSGKLIMFSIDGLGEGEGETIYNGEAAAEFKAEVSSGSYRYLAVFPGDEEYVYSEDYDHFVIVSRRPAKMECENIVVEPGGSFAAAAKLTDGLKENTGIIGEPVLIKFEYNQESYEKSTDDEGKIEAGFTAPEEAGEYFYTATYQGNNIYDFVMGTGTVTVQSNGEGNKKITTYITAEGAKVKPGEVFLSSATLHTANPEGIIPFRDLDMHLENSSDCVTTNDVGVATTTFTAPMIPGIYTLIVHFEEDEEYAESYGTAQVEVENEEEIGIQDLGVDETVLHVFEVNTYENTVFTAKAALTSGGVPVKSQKILFTFLGKYANSVTSETGIAEVLFTAPNKADSYVIEAEFAGDSRYKPSDTTADVIVKRLIVPGDPEILKVIEQTDKTATIFWTPVTVSEKGDDITGILSGYIIKRYADLTLESPEQVGFVDACRSPIYYTLERTEEMRYYAIHPVTMDSVESKGTKMIGISLNEDDPKLIFLSEDKNAWLELPNSFFPQLERAGRNGKPAQIRVEKQEYDGFLLSYRIGAFDGSECLENFEFNNSRKGANVVLYYNRLRKAGNRAFPIAGQNNQRLSVFWHNGVEWLNIGGANDIWGGKSSVAFRRAGRFALGASAVSDRFLLTKVVPRIFTPEESNPAINCVRFLFDNPNFAEVTIRIFDITGAVVRKNIGREGENVMYWDGRDMSGAIVKGGIYIYQIESEGETINGTIVVAK